MDTFRHILKLSAVATLSALVLTGCGQKAEEEAPLPPPQPKKVERPKETPTVAVTPAVKPPVVVPANPKPAPAPFPPKLIPQAPPEESVAQIVNGYQNKTDYSERVQQIYKLSDIGSAEAIVALGRLFQAEKDNDLKIEILDSMFDIDGLEDRKAALLGAGASADQPKEVRESAIDGLTDLDPKFSIPILNALVSDPDEDIRELAKDSIDQLQTQNTLQH